MGTPPINFTKHIPNRSAPKYLGEKLKHCFSWCGTNKKYKILKSKLTKYLKIETRKVPIKLFSMNHLLSDAQNTFPFSVLSTCIANVLTDQVIWASDNIPEHAQGAVLENGIIFNHVTKVLLAEKFINVDFLVPFPKFELEILPN